MEDSKSQLTILFDPPFWIGLYERTEPFRYEVCKITFGAEPKDYEVYDFLLKNWGQLHFTAAMGTAMPVEKRVNPKRMRRMIRMQVQQNTGIGTKAQQALKAQQEQRKREHKTYARKRQEMEKQRQFALREKKRKNKHRGH